MKYVDINSDLGESFGPYKMGDDEALLQIISSANVACGFHAGDPLVMDRTVRNALTHGVDIGAHPGFNDLAGFGRRPIQMDLSEIEKMVLYQLGALYAFCVVAGHKLSHVNFHGALGNMSFVDRGLATGLVATVKSFDPNLILLVLPNTEVERAAEQTKMRMARMFLADRAYDDNGLLVSRKLPGSVIRDPKMITQRVVQLLHEGTVTSTSGKKISTRADTILVHGDTAGSVEIARIVRQTVESSGAEVVPLSEMSL